MLLTFQGFFEEGRFVPSEPVQVPEHKKVIVTVLDEEASSKEGQENGLTERQAAYQRLLKYSGTLDRHVDYKKELLEYLDERYDNTH